LVLCREIVVVVAQESEVEREALALAEALRQAVGEFVRFVRKDVGTPTTARSETLGLLDRDGAMSIANLAQARNVKHQSMRLVVAQLECENLIDRRPNPDDARAQLIGITKAGQRLLMEHRDMRARMIGSLLEHKLSMEDREILRSAVKILQRLSTD
jgi:DNA-binding MarR family transcriptional regulator